MPERASRLLNARTAAYYTQALVWCVFLVVLNESLKAAFGTSLSTLPPLVAHSMSPLLLFLLLLAVLETLRKCDPGARRKVRGHTGRPRP